MSTSPHPRIVKSLRHIILSTTLVVAVSGAAANPISSSMPNGAPDKRDRIVIELCDLGMMQSCYADCTKKHDAALDDPTTDKTKADADLKTCTAQCQTFWCSN
jgi:hypothetical protein